MEEASYVSKKTFWLGMSTIILVNLALTPFVILVSVGALVDQNPWSSLQGAKSKLPENTIDTSWYGRPIELIKCVSRAMRRPTQRTSAETAEAGARKGEITVDLDKKTAVVHDGVKTGGYPLARQFQVNVRELGATGDGMTDDTAAILRAVKSGGDHGEIVLPPGEYKTTEKISLRTGQKLRGYGGARATIIRKAFHGDLIEVGDLCEVSGLTLECEGQSFKGSGIYVSAGFSQRLTGLHILRSESHCISYASGQGVGSVVEDLYATTTSPLLVPVIRVPTHAGGGAEPRFFNNIWMPGGVLDISGALSVFVNNAYLRFVKTDTKTGLCVISNVRMADLGAPLTISGVDCRYSNCLVAAETTISYAQGCSFIGCSFDSLVYDSDTSYSNQIVSQTTRYSPKWTQASGLQPVLGDGTLTGFYTLSGQTCTISFKLIAGSTTMFGNSTHIYRISLPFRATSKGGQRGIFINSLDVSAVQWYSLSGHIGASEKDIQLSYNGPPATSSTPIAWAAGDIIAEGTFTYAIQ